MTAITADSFTGSTPTTRVRPTSRLRLTTRGRRVLAALVALPLVVALGLALVSGGSALASLDDSEAATESFTSVIVGSGDSLWSIAEDVAPGTDPRDVVDAIVRLNALEGGNISAGQRLAVPGEYTGSP